MADKKKSGIAEVPKLDTRRGPATSRVVAQLSANRQATLDAVALLGSRKVAIALKRAQLTLQKRLPNINPGAEFTTAAQRQTLEQLNLMVRMLKVGVAQAIKEQSHAAAEQGADGMLRYLVDAERAYRGISSLGPRIEEAVRLDVAVAGADATVLRRVATDPGYRGDPAQAGVMDRYGIAVVSQFETTMQQALLTNQSWGETRQALIGDSSWLQEQPLFWAERILRTECLLGDCVVSGAVVGAVHRRWYEGPVVHVVSEHGRHFTATPNHPMLTRRGWVAAGSLRPTDDLVCYTGQQHPGPSGNEHVTHSPTTIAEVFDAAAAIGVCERRKTTQPDFHGDGMDGYVDVQLPNRELCVGEFASITKPLGEYVFAPSDLSSSTFCNGCQRLLTVDEEACHCRRSHDQPSLSDAVGNRTVRDSDVGSDVFGTFARRIPFDDVVGRDIEIVTGTNPSPIEERLSSSRELPGYASHLQHPFDCPRGEAEPLRYSVDAQPTDIEFDRVSLILLGHHRGHVYNLTTPDGYYCLNGAYTGNTMGASNRAGHECMQQAQEELGPVLRILSAVFDDRTGADSYAVHGQVRRMEEEFDTWYGPCMTPPDRPNDRGVVVPHMQDWDLPPELMPLDDSVVVARWVEQTASKKHPGGRPGMPPRPLMSTVPGFGIPG